MNTSIRILIALVLLPIAVFSQTKASRLAVAWEKFRSDPQLKYAGFSLTVVDVKSGEPVFSANGTMGLAPASTLKTVTSATAMYILGQNYRYQTALLATALPDAAGTLTGDLLISGTGDPTLGSPRYAETSESRVLANWLTAVKAAGIKRITGRIIGDDRLFGTQTVPGGWTWNDIGNYYGAGASALSWRENQFDLVFEPGSRQGDPVRSVRTEPAMPFLRLIDEVKTGPAGSGDGVVAYSSPYQSVVFLRGTHGIDLKKKIGAAVPDPAYDAAFRLKSVLDGAGIPAQTATSVALELQQGRSVPLATQQIATHQSPELSRIIYWLNQKSVNLYGELLLRTLALNQGKEPTFRNGANLIVDFWNQKLGIDKNALNIGDGSGLSPENRVTTLAMAQILAAAGKESWFAGFYESLPVNNDTRMKSGSIADVLAYAGYQPAAPGMLAFSVIVNNYNGSTAGIKQKIFTLLDAMK